MVIHKVWRFAGKVWRLLLRMYSYNSFHLQSLRTANAKGFALIYMWKSIQLVAFQTWTVWCIRYCNDDFGMNWRSRDRLRPFWQVGGLRDSLGNRPAPVLLYWITDNTLEMFNWKLHWNCFQWRKFPTRLKLTFNHSKLPRHHRHRHIFPQLGPAATFRHPQRYLSLSHPTFHLSKFILQTRVCRKHSFFTYL